MMPTGTPLSTSERVTSDHPKGRKATDLFRAAYDKADLNEERAQRLNENPDFAAGLRELIARCSVTNQYADEEVESSYGYLSGYRKPKPLSEQVAILRQLFPQLAQGDIAPGKADLSDGAEGNFVIPRWQAIAPTYGEAVEIVLGLLSQAYGGRFKNWRAGELGPNRLRQSTKSALAWDKIGEVQKSDILVVAAQFGLRHRGRSVRRAREVFASAEFGLGAFAVGIMLLTHLDRLQNVNDLWIDCAGDEFSSNAGGRFVCAPYFFFLDDKLKFGAGRIGHFYDFFGSASAFLPQ